MTDGASAPSTTSALGRLLSSTAPSASEISAAVLAGHVSSEEVTAAALDDIASSDDVNAFVYVDAEGALYSARALDRLTAAARSMLPLAGVPFGVKDLDDCRDMPTSQGSLLFKPGPMATEDSPLVSRMRAGGAVPIGKTAASEFGMDSATCTRAWGPTLNPWRHSRTPGGSSGGSAAAVAAGLVPVATGGDGGGSIRSPAGFCGLVGMMSSHGVIAMREASDMAVAGLLTMTVTDAARCLDVAAGVHPRDRTSLATAQPTFEADLDRTNVRGLRALWSSDLGYAAVDPDVVGVARARAEELCDASGVILEDGEFAPGNPYQTWIRLMAFELFATFSASGLWPARANELCDLTRVVLEIGGALSPQSYGAALLERQQIERQTLDLFHRYDLLVTPTTACTAFGAEGPIPERIGDMDATVTGAEPFTMVANMCWLPAISIPAGFSSDGMPVGLHVMASRRRDDQLLALARRAELEYPWPRIAPRSVASTVRASEAGNTT